MLKKWIEDRGFTHPAMRGIFRRFYYRFRSPISRQFTKKPLGLLTPWRMHNPREWEYVNWVAGIWPRESEIVINVNNLQESHGKNWGVKFHELRKTHNENGEPIGLIVIGPDIKEKIGYLELGPLSSQEGRGGANAIKINDTGSYEIKDFETYTLEIANLRKITLTNCRIMSLAIGCDDEDVVGTEFTATNTFIGSLHIGSGSLSRFWLKNCVIGDVKCPVPREESPFRGDVAFIDTSFFHTDASFSGNVQQYRNLRNHLASLDNLLAEGLIHTIVARLERAEQGKVERIISYGYDTASNFGNSIVRPLVCLFVLWCVSWLLLWAFGSCDILRSFQLALQPVLNPLGVFSGRTLVTPATSFGWIVLHVQAILSPILIFLFILAVRRKFKMK